MTRVEEIEMAVDSLSEEEFRKFRNWFLERDWEKWDTQLESDSAEGRLDFLVQEAMDEKKQGRLRGIPTQTAANTHPRPSSQTATAPACQQARLRRRCHST